MRRPLLVSKETSVTLLCFPASLTKRQGGSEIKNGSSPNKTDFLYSLEIERVIERGFEVARRHDNNNDNNNDNDNDNNNNNNNNKEINKKIKITK